jgi:glycosyltransferase involved in cell wall biosynthesis
MNLVVSLEQRFIIFEGKAYCNSVAFYEFWERYLMAFDKVIIVARAKKLASIPNGWKEATGPNVEFFSLPYYQGLYQYFQVLPLLLWKSLKIYRKHPEAAIIFRVPAASSLFLWTFYCLGLRKYALEVVGDPFDSLSPKVWRDPFVQIARLAFYLLLKIQCLNANAGVAYVTKHALQRRYPTKRLSGKSFAIPTGIRNFSFSDVVLAGRPFAEGSESATEIGQRRENKICFVGTLDSLYKGQIVLLKAMSLLLKKCPECTLVVVGGGKFQEKLQAMSESLSISHRTIFTGHISDPESVHSQMKTAAVFVLPSYQEGLPRAMLEAMSYGTPCVGTCVGGMPEILHPEMIVPPGEPELLAACIERLLNNNALWREVSKAGLKTTEYYKLENLIPLRREFYAHVRAQYCGFE